MYYLKFIGIFISSNSEQVPSMTNSAIRKQYNHQVKVFTSLHTENKNYSVIVLTNTSL